MKTVGDYRADGYAHLKGLIPPEVAQAFLQNLKKDLGPDAIPLGEMGSQVNLLRRPAFEIYGHHYPPMLFFLWGLTPIVSELVGCELLPTYDYFRIYREGDVCRVHSDRQSCEHSLSLTLDYSDGEIWNLDVGEQRHPAPSAAVDEDFGGQAFASIAMEVGDAVIYRGVELRHGRIAPNPNEWSAHLFLHWVERGGRYASHAFDGQPAPAKVNFSFA